MEELQRLEDRLFILEMRDRWSNEDYELYDRLVKQINNIKNSIKK